MNELYSFSEDSGAITLCVDSGVTEGFEVALTATLSAESDTACEFSTNLVIIMLYLLSCDHVRLVLTGKDSKRLIKALVSEVSNCLRKIVFWMSKLEMNSGPNIIEWSKG